MLGRESIRRGGPYMPVTPHIFPRKTPSWRHRPASYLVQLPFRREIKTAAPVSPTAILDSSSLPTSSSPSILPSLLSSFWFSFLSSF